MPAASTIAGGPEAGEVGGPGIAHEARGRYAVRSARWSLREGNEAERRSDEGLKMRLEVEPGSARAA